MAGKGSRFREVGVDRPKHEIPVRGKPMFDWAMKSLKKFFNHHFIFITHTDHSASSFLKNACARLGIENYSQITISSYTDGQATTATKADELVDDNDPIAIYNIDTYVEDKKIDPEVIKGEGFIPIFKAPGNRWSFVQIRKNGLATKISEKNKISDNATIGFYYFDCWEYFIEAYREFGNTVKRRYEEKYVAPLYNHLIKEGKDVMTYKINRSTVHVLGTPNDLSQFDPSFNPENI